MDIKQINNINSLKIFINNFDIRKDLHTFVSYIKDREIKRSYRSNALSKNDARKLAKMLTDPHALKDVETYGSSNWLDFIDLTALRLEWIFYNTKGEYIGNYSAEPSFPDNFIEFKREKYERFLELSIHGQEQRVLKILIESYSHDINEFFKTSVLGELDPFNSWGCATGIIPFINFAEVRWFLFDILKKMQSGIWYSTDSLIQYLKKQEPYFLIPQKPRFKNKPDKFEGRYCNFHESEARWGHEKPISSSYPDAFERVEGRYIERFLEGIPLIMGYIDTAYDPIDQKTLYPSLNKLCAFRINEKFINFMKGESYQPKVTVCPNFEIHVESVFYPINIINTLTPITEIVSNDKTIIFKLKKDKVLESLSKNNSFNIIILLKNITNQDLPENVITEIKEWIGHSENFILYNGYGLFETNDNLTDDLNTYVVKELSLNIKIVKAPDELFNKLEKSEKAPLLIEHKDNSFIEIPEGGKSIFSQLSSKHIISNKQTPIVLKRDTILILHFPNKIILESCRKSIIKTKCPINVETENLTISYSYKYKSVVESAIKSIENGSSIQIEDSK